VKKVWDKLIRRTDQERTQGERAAGLHLSNTQNRNLKHTNFVDIVISKVVHDLPFSRYQPLKSAHD
jgi:hypothetical protein